LFARVIASGNHLLTQVKDNQPGLRRRLEKGAARRKPSGCAKSETTGRNRWETRELSVFPAKAWFRHTPWDGLINTMLRLKRTVWRRNPANGALKQTTETVFWVSSASGATPQRWNEWIRAHSGVLMSCLPGCGAGLTALAGQLGLRLAEAQAV